MADAEAVGQRRIDIEDFTGNPMTFFIVGALDRANGAGAFGQFDQGDTHIVDHCHQHLAQVFHLRLRAEHQ
ncbi:hypothetical protein D3C76_1775320 [compost metagenome]